MNAIKASVETIQKPAHTRNAREPRLFLIPVEQTVKIPTGERDTHQ